MDASQLAFWIETAPDRWLGQLLGMVDTAISAAETLGRLQACPGLNLSALSAIAVGAALAAVAMTTLKAERGASGA